MTTAALAEPVVLTDARMDAVTAGQLLAYAPGLTNVIPTNPYSPDAVRATRVFGAIPPNPILPPGYPTDPHRPAPGIALVFQAPAVGGD